MPGRKELPAALRRTTPTPSVTGHALPDAIQQSLALPRPEPERSCRAAASSKLWLCIYLPALPLEALNDAVNDAAKMASGAVFEDQQGVRRVLMANREARAAGIVPGLSANAALALEPTLELAERNPARERQVLERLAGWAERFTSFISLEAPAVLLLEIAGSLKLFGGLTNLRKRISTGLEQQGFHASMAIAPTPLAATWLAKAGRRVCIRDTANLTGAISPLPLSCLDWPDSVCEALRGMGISGIGDCLRLPRSGFTKRFGACRLLQLDRALGRLPDPRVGYRSPERFVREYELSGEQSDADLLLHACRQLLCELESFLLTRQLAVQNIQFSFFHLRAPATCLTLGCVRADRAVRHWSELLGIRFERLQLPEPVIAIRLCGGRSQLYAVETNVLPFSETASRRQDASITHLVERLCARIGDASVHGVMTVAEHRPQYAWRAHYSIADEPRAPQCEAMSDFHRSLGLLLKRPLWMLPKPAPLALAHGHPVYQGTLEFLGGPERLETGWWDDDGIARDYFVAANPQGVRLWVFRNRNGDAGWYLHGIFG